MFQILHTADLHLGARINPAGLPQHLLARVADNALQTFFHLCDFAVSRKVHAVVIAGDLFHSSNPPRTLTTNVLDTIARSPSVQFVIAPGNHDPRDTCNAWSKYALPENLHLFPDQTIRPLTPPGAPITFWGYAWETTRDFDNPLAGFRIPDGAADTYNVLVAHASEESTQPDNWTTYAHFHAHLLHTAHLDYVALGHHHHWHRPMHDDRVPFIYPGNPCPDSRRDVLPHHFALVSFTEEGTVTEQIRSESIEFFTDIIHVGGANPRAGLKNVLTTKFGSPPIRAIADLTLIGTPTAEDYAALPGIVERARPLFLHLAVEDFTADPATFAALLDANPEFMRYLSALDECIRNAETLTIAKHFTRSRSVALADFIGEDQKPRLL